MDENGHESAGQEFARWLRPAGCVFVLILAVLALVICFTHGKDPIPGYKPPQTSEYYSRHMDELQAELEENVFPIIGGVEKSEIDGGKLTVTLDSGTFAVTRSAILRYYDVSLFEFVDNAK